MFWIGVAPEPLKRNQLLPDTNDDASIKKAANLLAEAINCALSLGVRERALDIAKRISRQNGVAEAVRILKEEVVVDSGSVNPSA